MRIFLIFLAVRSVGLLKWTRLFRISEETPDLVWEETKSIPCITLQKPFHSVSGCASFNLPFSFAVLPLLIIYKLLSQS